MSDIKESRDLTNKITNATSVEDIRAALYAEATRQGIVAIQDGGYVMKEPTTTGTATISRTETIGGQDVTFTASTPLELEQQISAAHREAQKSDSYNAGQNAFVRAELELKFKRGEISTKEYLEQSGAVEEFLNEHGVDTNAITSAASNETDWSTATEAFLNSPDGQDWPGGAENLNLMGQKLQTMGLTGTADKSAALAQAWNEMKKGNNYVPYIETARETTRDSEVATPEEIVDAWKRSLAAQGINEGQAFTETFGSKKAKSSSTIFN